MSKLLVTVICLVSFVGIASAADWDKRTVITLHDRVMVAGVPVVTLEPGKYVIKIQTGIPDRNVVQIFNEREDRLFTTVLSLPNYRMKPTANTEVRLWETPVGNPPALRAWFYPGENFGHEFVYPKGLAARIAEKAGEPVLIAEAATPEELETAPVTEITQAGEEKPLEPAYTTPAPQPEPQRLAAAAPPPAPVPQPEPAPLPQTGTPLFALAMVGGLATMAGLLLRLLGSWAS